MRSFHYSWQRPDGGSRCTATNSPEDIYAKLARRAQEAGVTVLIDACGEVLMQALAYSPVLVKLNDQKLVATCREPINTEGALREAAQMLISRDAQWVLITQGKKRRLDAG